MNTNLKQKIQTKNQEHQTINNQKILSRNGFTFDWTTLISKYIQPKLLDWLLDYQKLQQTCEILSVCPYPSKKFEDQDKMLSIFDYLRNSNVINPEVSFGGENEGAPNENDDDDPIYHGGQYKQFINRLLISNYFYNSTFFKQANLIYKGGISKNNNINNDNQTTHFHGFCKGIEFLSKFRKTLKLSDYTEKILFNPDKITCFDHFMCNFQDQEILKNRCPVFLDKKTFSCFYPKKHGEILDARKSPMCPKVSYIYRRSEELGIGWMRNIEDVSPYMGFGGQI